MRFILASWVLFASVSARAATNLDSLRAEMTAALVHAHQCADREDCNMGLSVDPLVRTLFDIKRQLLYAQPSDYSKLMDQVIGGAVAEAKIQRPSLGEAENPASRRLEQRLRDEAVLATNSRSNALFHALSSKKVYRISKMAGFGLAGGVLVGGVAAICGISDPDTAIIPAVAVGEVYPFACMLKFLKNRSAHRDLLKRSIEACHYALLKPVAPSSSLILK